MTKKWYSNDPILQCAFIKIFESELTIVIVYVDNMN